MKFILSFIIIAAFTLGVNAQNSKHQILDKATYQDSLVQPNATLIDVRTSEEYESGHLDKAQNIDFLNEELFITEIEKFDKSQPIYIYCRSGNRSGKAATLMQKLGFQTIYDLEGGYLNWTSQSEFEK
ncbi:rhodanese-like domain-containing protein [Leeuwenhoekiella aequorea]|uniref:Rhodanese-related sulfurtransferase n=1 Tax=Leeuwenhoekiella aequorea TaxID=283736 RepID=A0A4Q0PB10_9FLAO|nr:rhodanese-like domain-containing protein [Leeuwenhoekiella aequorea]RXG23761.1 rhodanese-related sulfurtransferase [Leeuwenhoekiella aequorea]